MPCLKMASRPHIPKTFSLKEAFFMQNRLQNEIAHYLSNEKDLVFINSKLNMRLIIWPFISKHRENCICINGAKQTSRKGAGWVAKGNRQRGASIPMTPFSSSLFCFFGLVVPFVPFALFVFVDHWHRSSWNATTHRSEIQERMATSKSPSFPFNDNFLFLAMPLLSFSATFSSEWATNERFVCCPQKLRLG